MPAARPLAERFHEKYVPVPFSGCWIWIGSLDSYGYGLIASGRGPRLAHRVSWELHNGNIERQTHVLHRCDTPCCVNPMHLFLGSHADNMRDCAKKGRSPNLKLNAEQIADIRTKRLKQKEFAQLYGCSRPNISVIQTRKTWDH